MEDPNWFFSTLAQSAAAIVGLIGAFLVSRIVEQANEVRGKKKELLERIANLEINEAKVDMEKIARRYDENIIRLKSKEYKASYTDGELGIIILFPNENLEIIIDRFTNGIILFKHRNEFLSNIEISPIYGIIEPPESHFAVINHLVEWVSNPPKGVNINIEVLESRFKKVIELDEKIRTISNEYSDFVEYFTLPSYFKYGLYILGFIAVFCVIVPLLFLSAGPHKFLGFYVKNLLLTLFTIGIISLLVFFKLQIDEIRKFVKP